MKQTIDDRLNLTNTGARIGIEGASIVLTLDEIDTDGVRTLGQVSTLRIRPVLHVIGQSPGGPSQGGSAGPTASATSVLPRATSAPNTDTVAEAKALRQSTDPDTQVRAITTLDCSAPDPLDGQDDPTRPLVACSTNGSERYVLGPSVIDGTGIVSATTSSVNDRPVILVTFTSAAADVWSRATSDNVGRQLAFVADSGVISAPFIQEATPPGTSTTQISGLFTAQQGTALARQMQNSGSGLELTSTVKMTVSPTK
ncbi:SecDF P1 head subdomain-containing protein [Nocardia sp. NBC_01388]|uniref:SecDF P1 head subdomain-containing protein n=1 Tax=Nocardia sp. NBC_01388 TaxID=2903596 RepID=UPI0032441C64